MMLASEFRTRSEMFVGRSPHVAYGTSLEVAQSFKVAVGGSTQEDVQGLEEWHIHVSAPDLVDET